MYAGPDDAGSDMALSEAQSDEHLTGLLARAYLSRSAHLGLTGRNEMAGAAARKSIELTRRIHNPELLVQAYIQLAISSIFYDPADGHAALEAALSLSSTFPDKYLHAVCLAVKGVSTVTSGGDARAGREHIEAALALDPQVISLAPGGYLAYIIFERLSGNWERARQLVEAGLNEAESAALPPSKRLVLAYQAERAHIERQTGNLDAALNTYARLILAYRELSMEPAAANMLECFGMVAVAQGRYARAGQLFGAAEALRERLNEDMTPYERVEYEPALARLRALVEPEVLQATWEQGRAMNLDQAIELAGRYVE
jgi:tetratricopeptide (TPR) repeat protein